jgi:hypothetical protein
MVMVTVFWDGEGMIPVDVMMQDETILTSTSGH